MSLLCDNCNARPCRCVPNGAALERRVRRLERLGAVLTITVDAMSTLLAAPDRATAESIIRERLSDLLGDATAAGIVDNRDPFWKV